MYKDRLYKKVHTLRQIGINESGDDGDLSEPNDEDYFPYLSSSEESDDSCDEDLDLSTNNNEQQWSSKPIKEIDISKEPGPNVKKTDFKKRSSWQVFNLFFTDDVLSKICFYTNLKAKELKINLNIDIPLLKKFMGLILSRAFLPHIQTEFIFSKYDINIFQRTMTLKEFEDILLCLRFDCKNTRSERTKGIDGKPGDRLAPISEIWNDVADQFKNFYIPSQNISVDQRIYECKARCSFNHCVPSKDEKICLRYYIVEDCKTKYILNCLPDLAIDIKRPKNLLLNVALELLAPYKKMNINVLTTYHFTSLKLAKILMKENINLVGVVHPNRNFIPKISHKKIKKYESTVVSCGNGTLIAHKFNSEDTMFMFTNLHEKINFANNRKKEPEPIDFFISTKGFDYQGSTEKYIESSSKKWLFQMFHNLLDMTFFNSWILYNEIHNTKVSRKKFMKRLIFELTGHQIY